MLNKEMITQQLEFNKKDLNLFHIVKSNIKIYENEDGRYYKPQDTQDWYLEWDFKEYNPNIFSHGFHQYPAKFIPQLARKLLRVFTNKESVVLDNFVGSGTTLVESMLLNVQKAIGIELNPFACFMAKVKTTPINPEKLEVAFKKIVKNFLLNKKFTPHTFYNIEFWFRQK